MCSTTHLIIILVLIVLISLILIIVFIIFILKLILIEVFQSLLELQSLTREPVDGARDQFLLDIFTELVIELEFLLQLLVYLIFVVIGWWERRVEEVEEGGCWDGLLHDSRLFRVCADMSVLYSSSNKHDDEAHSCSSASYSPP